MKIQKMLATSLAFTVMGVGGLTACKWPENHDYECQTNQKGGGPKRSADCVQDPSTGVKTKVTGKK